MSIPAVKKMLFASLVVGSMLAGCMERGSADLDKQPHEDAPASLVAGWSCEDDATCFGLHVGRVRVFERRVGTRVVREVWTTMDRVRSELGTRFAQDGGPETYELRHDGLYMPFRGELLRTIPFPATPGSAQEVVQTSGGQVSMSITPFDGLWTSPAGSFEHCVEHAARFENAEVRGREGLVVETVFCEGIGEVAQTIRIPEMPHPVTITLVELPDSAPTSQGPTEVRTASTWTP